MRPTASETLDHDPLDLHGVQKPQRWDVPFWQEGKRRHARPMTPEDIERILSFKPFADIDPTRFPESLSLDNILLNDSRIRKFKRGQIVVREGDYGNSAFFILSGSVSIATREVDPKILGRRASRKLGFFQALAQLWRKSRTAEFRNLGAPGESPRARRHGAKDNEKTIFLSDVTNVIEEQKFRPMSEGELFGEIAALTRTPRTATIFAERQTEILEIRWQGLRDIRQRSPEIREHVDRLYRERALKAHLRATPLFQNLSPEALARLAEATELQTYGNFDWHASYKKVQEMSPAERLRYEPVVAQEGHYPNGVFLLRSGFARLSEPYNHGERTVSYLGKGRVFGLEEIAYNHFHRRQIPFRRTLRGLGHLDVLFIPTRMVEELVLPSLDRESIPGLEEIDRASPPSALPSTVDSPELTDVLEFLVERRFINGTQSMVIDMDRCTRCDDCVRACAATHDNNPCFIRHGPIKEGFMIASACMHCQDPVCMIGCPTGAIHRMSAEGQVVINDETCIGCATCANSCPYNNIQVVVARDSQGHALHDAVTHKPIEKATKCDLCLDQPTGPACANACPHDALARLDLSDWDEASDWFRR